MSETIRDRLQECVGQLQEPFRASEIVGWFRRRYPDLKEQSLRAHIQGATSNVSLESRGQFANRRPLITRVSHGVYRRYDGRPDDYAETLRRSVAVAPLRDLDLDQAVARYLGARDANARYASFDYCFNHFQQHRSTAKSESDSVGMEASCLQLGFYLASWGMLRGSAELLQRSARHLIPLVSTIADAPKELWELDVDGYDADGLDLLLGAAADIRHALRPLQASDTLVTKVMLGVFGCVPAFDTYFKKGFGVSTFSSGSLRLVGDFYRANAEKIDGLRPPTLDFSSGRPTTRLYTRAKVVDMIFFIKGGYTMGAPPRHSQQG